MRPNQSLSDPLAETQLHRAAARHPILPPHAVRKTPPRRSALRWLQIGCFWFVFANACLAIFASLYFLLPTRTNILILGVDARPEDKMVARTDTIILTTILPYEAYVGMLSIPRDLWVIVPGVGENRINTAHFFAEAANPGSGPSAALATVHQNFGIDVHYYVRLRFDGFQQVVDAFDGVMIHLEQPVPGYPAGDHTLTGEEALAFVRNRTGSDDFYRMSAGQIFIKALWQKMLMPDTWRRLPQIYAAMRQSVDLNIPIWQWPRLAFALLRAGPARIDNRVITREMVNPFTTDGGAQVLGPNWDKINPILSEMFGQ